MRFAGQARVGNRQHLTLARVHLVPALWHKGTRVCETNCGGDLKIIAVILEVVPDSNGSEDRLCLAHAMAPPRAPARRPQLQAA